MINPLSGPTQFFVDLYNELPIALHRFISLVLLLFIIVVVFRLLWRSKG